MSESEIMHCAAVLAAGVMANRSDLVFDAERAVNLMRDIAEEIANDQNAELSENEEWL